MKKLIPLILFVVIAIFLYFSLNSTSSKLPSPLLGKMFPNIEAQDFYSDESVLLTDLFSDNTSLVNVWASWCVTWPIKKKRKLDKLFFVFHIFWA